MFAPARIYSSLILGAALLLFGQLPALACACCSHPAQRFRSVEQMESFRAEEFARLRFAAEAELRQGENDGLPSVADPGRDWQLSVTQVKERLTFTLRDSTGRTGSFAFSLPPQLSVSMTDTRDRPDEGQGPPLYTEWALTAPFCAEGIFRAASKSRNLTLVLQGRGNSCADAKTFTHWLLNFGPRDNFAFYGALAEPKP